MTQTVQFHPWQFRAELTEVESRDLFRHCVQFVEIETFTFCNRKCWFCPNATMPERQDRARNQYMDEALYLRILADLASIDYGGQIQFGRYNEPLADRIILTRIRQASERLPAAWLYTHTNGDFLTREYLAELRGAGLRGLAVQTYLGNEQAYDEQKIVARQAQQLRRLGLKIARTICDEPHVRHYHVTDYPGLQVTLDARNFPAIGTDRGGLVPVNISAGRTAPCLIPFTNMYVDWSGNVMPCCNLRSDRVEHQQYVVSQLQDGTSLFSAYVALHGWRESLMRFGPKPAPCNTCSHEAQVVQESAAPQLAELYDELHKA